MRGKIAKQLRKGTKVDGRTDVDYNVGSDPVFTSVTLIDGKPEFDVDSKRHNESTQFLKKKGGVPTTLNNECNRYMYQQAKKLWKNK